MKLFDRHGHPLAQRNVLRGEQSAKTAKPAYHDGLTASEWERRHGERIEANLARVERELAALGNMTCETSTY